MRLSQWDNVLIMSAIYSESLTHSLFSSPYPSVSRTVCHVICVTVSSVVEFYFSLTIMGQSDSDPCRPQGRSSLHCCGCTGRWGGVGGGAVNREFDEPAKIFILQKRWSLFFGGLGGCTNPLTFNNSSFWQQWACSGRVSGWACWAQQAIVGICLAEWVSREPIWKPLKS